MITIYVPEEIARRLYSAIGSAVPGERIEHELKLKLVEGDKYTAGIRTLANGVAVDGELFVPCVVKVGYEK